MALNNIENTNSERTMSSSNISTSRCALCASCQGRFCRRREPDTLHHAPGQSPLPRYLRRNEGAFRHSARHPSDDDYRSYLGSDSSQPGLGENYGPQTNLLDERDNYPSGLAATYYPEASDLHSDRANSPFGLERSYYPEASSINSRNNSPSSVGYTFYPSGSDLGEASQGGLEHNYYPEASSVNSRNNSRTNFRNNPRNNSSPLIGYTFYSSSSDLGDSLQGDLLHHYPSGVIPPELTSSPTPPPRFSSPPPAHNYNYNSHSRPYSLREITTALSAASPRHSLAPQRNDVSARNDPFYFLSSRHRPRGDEYPNRTQRGIPITPPPVSVLDLTYGFGYGYGYGYGDGDGDGGYAASGARGDALGFYPYRIGGR